MEEAIFIEHRHQLRVRYSETDQMGIVYYGNYAQYFEVARVEFLRDLGFVYKGIRGRRSDYAGCSLFN